MKFSDFFKCISSAFPYSGTRIDLLCELFSSIGLSLSYSESTKEKLYTGERPLSMDLKRESRQVFNLQSAITFFQDLCAGCDQKHVIAKLGLPETEQVNKEALSAAFAQQFQRIIDSDGSEAEDILLQSYRKNCSTMLAGEPLTEIQSPHYPGDRFFIPTPPALKNAGCYEAFQHTWEIENTGTQTWEERCLYILESDRSDFTLVRILEKNIRLPKTLPHQKQKITAHLETRGKEGRSEYYWVMQDALGNVCFPEQDCGNITVDVTFTL